MRKVSHDLYCTVGNMIEYLFIMGQHLHKFACQSWWWGLNFLCLVVKIYSDNESNVFVSSVSICFERVWQVWVMLCWTFVYSGCWARVVSLIVFFRSISVWVLQYHKKWMKNDLFFIVQLATLWVFIYYGGNIYRFASHSWWWEPQIAFAHI